MESRDRVLAVIRHQKPDRIPIYGWVKANLSNQIAEAFGSVEAFEDHYEFDFAHLFGGPPTYDAAELESLTSACNGAVTPADLLQLTPVDPNSSDAYESIRAEIAHHQTQRGRFVYVQTPGIFEALNGPFGIENHLAYMIEYQDDLRRVYQRQAEWNRAFAMNCLDLGVDMIHVSDDWGAQHNLLFSPRLWWELIFPMHQVTTSAVKERGGLCSLHSDGNVNAIISGITKLGYDVVHPWQESAGMSLDDFKANYISQFSVMGGLDIQTTLGFGRLDELKAVIERLVAMFSDGGLLLCTTHYVQDHCSIKELTYAYDTVYELVRKCAFKGARSVCRGSE